MIATAVAVEMLRFPVEAQRAKVTLDALARAGRHAGVQLSPSRSFRGGADWLMVWGPGAPDRAGHGW